MVCIPINSACLYETFHSGDSVTTLLPNHKIDCEIDNLASGAHILHRLKFIACNFMVLCLSFFFSSALENIAILCAIRYWSLGVSTGGKFLLQHGPLSKFDNIAILFSEYQP